MPSPDDFPSLRHQLLIAMPRLGDPRFNQSVTYLFEHNEEGAMGVIINRPLDLPITELFSQVGIVTTVGGFPGMDIVYGGPVQESRGFVLHRTDPQLPAWQHSVDFPGGATLTTSRDVLEAIAAGRGPTSALIALGYAGWGPGQLEEELADNSWLLAPADSDILFDLPFESRWRAAAGRIGVNLSLISPDAGHA